MFKTTMMSPELIQLLEVVDVCGLSKARLKLLVKSGFLHDLFDRMAVLSDRTAFCKALDLGLERLGIYQFVVEYNMSVKKRIEEGKMTFPWRVDMREEMFEGQWMDDLNSDYSDDAKHQPETFEARLLEMHEGISRERVLQRIAHKDRGNPWMPADTDHMLAFASKYPEVLEKGDFRYIVGLGTTPSVLARFFQGLGSGTSYNFIPMSRKWKKCHDGGKQNRFLVVRRI